MKTYVEMLQIALKESLKLQSHYATLLNQYDGGRRITFKTNDKWIERLRETGTIEEDADGLYVTFEDHEVALTEAQREVGELQKSLAILYGAKFSDRNYHALKDRAEKSEAAQTAAIREVGEIARKLGHTQAELDEAVRVIEDLYSCKYEPDKMLCIVQRWRQALAAKEVKQTPSQIHGNTGYATGGGYCYYGHVFIYAGSGELPDGYPCSCGAITYKKAKEVKV